MISELWRVAEWTQALKASGDEVELGKQKLSFLFDWCRSPEPNAVDETPLQAGWTSIKSTGQLLQANVTEPSAGTYMAKF